MKLVIHQTSVNLEGLSLPSDTQWIAFSLSLQRIASLSKLHTWSEKWWFCCIFFAIYCFHSYLMHNVTPLLRAFIMLGSMHGDACKPPQRKLFMIWPLQYALSGLQLPGWTKHTWTGLTKEKGLCTAEIWFCVSFSFVLGTKSWAIPFCSHILSMDMLVSNSLSNFAWEEFTF